MYIAIEEQEDISKTIEEWRVKFSKDAINLDGFGGGNVFWHTNFGIWGFFGGRSKYWNTFGTTPTRFRQHMRVEINPPKIGTSHRTQGVVARDRHGRRWMMHKGRMAIKGRGISFEDFLEITHLKPVEVSFQDGSKAKSFPVVCIEDGHKDVQRSVADFVLECERVRLYYESGQKALEVEDAAAKLETGFPEKTGKYDIPPQDLKTVDRLHAEVWHALKEILDRLSIKNSNKKIGRCGPDLYTTQIPKILFEIKVQNSMSDLQKAVGQLMIYEKALGEKYKKILVFPHDFSKTVKTHLNELNLHTMTYKKIRGSAVFDEKEVTRICEQRRT